MFASKLLFGNCYSHFPLHFPLQKRSLEKSKYQKAPRSPSIRSAKKKCSCPWKYSKRIKVHISQFHSHEISTWTDKIPTKNCNDTITHPPYREFRKPPTKTSPFPSHSEPENGLSLSREAALPKRKPRETLEISHLLILSIYFRRFPRN